jgi:hypothetical protein
LSRNIRRTKFSAVELARLTCIEHRYPLAAAQ